VLLMIFHVIALDFHLLQADKIACKFLKFLSPDLTRSLCGWNYQHGDCTSV
jgi:hypothetical protein